MTDLTLLDNDIVLKACAYKWHRELLTVATLDDGPPVLLTVAKFAVRDRLQRGKNLNDRTAALSAFDELLDHARTIDPTAEELEFAADLEEAAGRHGLDLDVGESQLVAILLLRPMALLMTGDKRAISAISQIKGEAVGRRIISLEMLATLLLERISHDEMRRLVCAEPTIDRAMTSCFSCKSGDVQREDILAGLCSYYRGLEQIAAAVLAPLDRLQGR